ncbi:GNAT family N-acetyltransferase [Agarivorans gilvus]|uniref:N-acetyltransferase domain-containing protein n=1 Tax=Agarivorans gilvus TaxID=680279 RepID=A0ABQ1I4H0_9ALTE|nr:GNAT family N-acetyltransferase [Agarivorans gilvus]GGB15820.1 hypothetical protein GCM10007414_31620 [Agarivorans gilvus]
MKISVVNSNDIEVYQNTLNEHLMSVFGQDSRVVLNREFVCAVLVEDENQLVATGLAYSRTMKQNATNFKAGIIGGVSVRADKRGLGLAKVIIKELEQCLVSVGVTHSFLFAYEPNVYRSSGYTELTAAIHYFDLTQNKWQQFVYRGGMVKCLKGGKPLSDQRIEFNGCVY